MAHYFRAAVMDQILVDNRTFLKNHVHSTPPLTLIVLSRLDRGIQSAKDMLPFKRGRGVACGFNCTCPTFFMCILLTHLYLFMSAR